VRIYLNTKKQNGLGCGSRLLYFYRAKMNNSGYSLVVEDMLSMCEILGSTHSTVKTTKSPGARAYNYIRKKKSKISLLFKNEVQLYNFIYLFIFIILLFICSYKAWVISPPSAI
jgi:hypothetical protein